MNRLMSACLLLAFTACTVPSLDELHPCDIENLTGGEADAVLGDKATCRAIKATVEYSGFLPGCVLVTVRDEGSGRELSSPIEGKGARTGGSLAIAVLPPTSWGASVQVEARAYEQRCEQGAFVVSSASLVTLTPDAPVPVTLSLQARDTDGDGYVDVLSGGTDCDDTNAAVRPGAEERCNDVDDNCDGISDEVELRLGQSCTVGENCPGVRACGPDSDVICNAPDAVFAYPDRDQDGRGDMNATPRAFCTGIEPGYVPGPADDCDDTNASIRPGAQELCNGVDDNCDGNIDETFPQLGDACEVAAKCPGIHVCDPSGITTRCEVTVSPSDWYVDEDGDGVGSGPATPSCGPPGTGYVNLGDDCNDGNPFIYPGATELCDGFDNNCDGSIDGIEVCPQGNPRFVTRTVGMPEQQWRSIFTQTPGDVMAVGSGGNNAVLIPGTTTFDTSAFGCGASNTNWNAVWADMENNGRGYIGSSGGRLVFLDRNENACTQAHDMGRSVQGLIGFRHEGTLEIHGVTSDSGSINQGLTFIWNGGSGSGALTFGPEDVAPLYDVHGRSRSTLFAVGGYETGSTRPRLYRFNASSSQWQSLGIQDSIPGLGRLRGVWVANDKVAFAVGEAASGSNTVIQWNGSAWSRMVSFPNTHLESLTSVIAFGAKAVYITAESGRIYRYDGHQWQIIFDSPSYRFYDIAGTSPADLWVAGDNGQLLHWPQ
ncbi:MopE-related protein [Myxococcus sp. Y35]|uniref:MopE-related protein n=1 Tax=Pseudomyxococcus flavus TaxID=3115648 RepID=UPI003CE9E7C7